MGKFIDLTGYKQPNGRLTVIERAPNRGKKVYWKCKCECGNVVEVNSSKIKNEHTKSCGCLRSENASKHARELSEMALIDLTEQTFDDLLVLRRSYKRNKNNETLWECQCKCGNISLVTGHSLRSGNTRSCGCRQKNHAIKIGKQRLIEIEQGKEFGELTVLDRFENSSNGEAVWRCKCSCGTICYVTSSHLRDGHTRSCGCSLSRGEAIVSRLLTEASIYFIKEKKFNNCRFNDTDTLARFDFFVGNNYIVEYDGIQHFKFTGYGWDTEEAFKKRQERDAYKNQWCKENNIPLIRIPYWHLDDLCIDDLRLETTKFRVV